MTPVINSKCFKLWAIMFLCSSRMPNSYYDQPSPVQDRNDPDINSVWEKTLSCVYVAWCNAQHGRHLCTSVMRRLYSIQQRTRTSFYWALWMYQREWERPADKKTVSWNQLVVNVILRCLLSFFPPSIWKDDYILDFSTLSNVPALEGNGHIRVPWM